MKQKREYRQITGVLLLDKPIGISSNQALQHAKRIFNAKKAGHTGSLDVLATGLLPICFGRATKFTQFLLNADKYYKVTACLGKHTTTGDAEGEILETKPISHINEAFLNEVLAKFRGKIQQIPPMFSALKHHGKPLYQLARQGIEIDREPRFVHINKLTLLEWNNEDLTLEVHCSKGTYIRTLIDDIGKALGCGAYVTMLRRIGAGSYNISDALTLDQLQEIYDQSNFDGIDAHVLPIESMLRHLSALLLSDAQIQLLKIGRSLTLSIDQTGLFRLIDKNNRFLGLGKIDGNGSMIAKRLI